MLFMKEFRSVVLLAVWFVLSLSGSADEAVREEAKTPKAEAKVEKGPIEPAFAGEALVLKKQMDELFEASKRVNQSRAKAGARAKIESSLDWQRIAHDCLGPTYWAKQPAKSREEFEKLLKEVIVKSAYSRMDKFWDHNTTYKFEKIAVKGDSAVVVAKFLVRKDSFGLEYFFHRKEGTWYIDDISFDEVKYSVNINEQIEAFLKEKNFATLLDKLRKRRDELDSDIKASAKKS